MFDLNKYDNSNDQSYNNSNDNSNEFIAKRQRMIKWFGDARPLIIKECESLEEYLKRSPNGKAAGPFREKLEGWSKMLNGMDIITRKYSKGN